ncbi:hypothetical protein [Eubacterium aggregans]|uniref:hypothetical protein n=1 Tax=Eubacterium aggregans TaxID=81409 RepID=UPI0023F0DA63|nr:hypothetical protein [Eubacterium aggregans]MDD4692491.1 hypothetical protein [Eubacterium aggregans]
MRNKCEHGITGNKTDKRYKGRLKEIRRSKEQQSDGTSIDVYTFVITRALGTMTYTFRGEVPIDLRQYFTPGDRVLHHVGCAIPELLDKSKTYKVCMDCGAVIKRGQACCPFCGYSFI